MLDMNAVLDAAQKTCSPATGNGLAAALNVKPSAVSNWKHGRAYPDVVSCERIAQMIGEPPLRLIAQVNELRAISKSEKAVWHRIAMAALLALASAPGMASTSYNLPVLPIMSARHRLARFLRSLCSAGVRPNGHLLAL